MMNFQKNIGKFIIMVKKIKKWLDINVSWFFVNGRKQKDWQEYINKKYNL